MNVIFNRIYTSGAHTFPTDRLLEFHQKRKPFVRQRVQ
ncbi:hypothetical protein CBNA_0060 [Coxiella burnetii str. Namibia]|nr:hypothetical protein CBNA_0060 [Coxiella burnetii str. Namibia]